MSLPDAPNKPTCQGLDVPVACWYSSCRERGECDIAAGRIPTGGPMKPTTQLDKEQL